MAINFFNTLPRYDISQNIFIKFQNQQIILKHSFNYMINIRSIILSSFVIVWKQIRRKYNSVTDVSYYYIYKD